MFSTEESIEAYRAGVLKAILDHLEPFEDVLAAWEGGSIATNTKDQFSDIDLCFLANNKNLNEVLNRVEQSLVKLHIEHKWQAQKSVWGEGMMQRVFILKDSPKYFLVDVAIFDIEHAQLLKDFLEFERHGQPVIHFDKSAYIQVGHTDAMALFKKQQLRLNEIEKAFPVYKLLVLKEHERKNKLDSLAFYQNGILRPLIEILGMLYRPYKYDFGMRYIHKNFPQEIQNLLVDLSYVESLSEIPDKLAQAEKILAESIVKFRNKTQL